MIITGVPLSAVLARYDHVLLDLDGCLWVGDEPREGATEAVAALREAGKGLAFMTNDVRHAPEEFVRKLWRLGFQASVDEVVTCGAALQFVLADRHERGAAFVIGSQALVDHVADAGCGSSTTRSSRRAPTSSSSAGTSDFDYRELRIATQAVLRGAELIGVTRDRTFPMPDGPWPGSGGDPRRGRGGDRAPRASARSASPSRTCTRPRATGSAPGRYLGGRRPARRRRRGRAARRDRQRARAHRRHHARRGRGGRPAADARRGLARRAVPGLIF